jgi:hypothetical protein
MGIKAAFKGKCHPVHPSILTIQIQTIAAGAEL